MNFTRGLDPKEAMGIGIYANPTTVKCLKNMYSNEYHRLLFTRKYIYEIDTKRVIGAWVVYDCYGRPVIFADKTFKEYFKIIA